MDALLNALSNETAGEVQDQECPVLHVASVRTCEFCGSTNTPTWRRGPAGKASLCNACGIKWRLRKRLKKGDQERNHKEAPEKPKKKKKERKEKDLTPISKTIFKERIDHDNERDYRKKGYFCKYCNKTWAFTQFKNSQQFGAHCSNCSRRPRGVKGGSSYEVPSTSMSPISDHEYYTYEEYHEEEELSPYEEEGVYSPVVPQSPMLSYHQEHPIFARLAHHQIIVEESPTRHPIHHHHHHHHQQHEEELYDFKSLQQLASIAEDARIRQRSVLSCLASIVAS
eukprot:TRINITY_DN6107_c0_g1_i1.p1 TRINITY_DN6107_c0_g1~~TRINITY_DN6107_c0_g1_i1.p1  ORF type:complete len:283 (+),score=61.27 TRINITY_DN6107_c0_g1_i1:127-975(+)